MSLSPIFITNGERDENNRLICLFSPANFNEAFSGISIAERNALFHSLIFGTDNENVVLSDIIQNDENGIYSFLSNTLKLNRGSYIYKNTRIVEYIIDFFIQNESEQFFQYLFRIDQLWKKENTISQTMQHNLYNFFTPTDGINICDKCINSLSGQNDEIYNCELYMQCIKALHIAGKDSYAYALIVLWGILNIHSILLLLKCYTERAVDKHPKIW